MMKHQRQRAIERRVTETPPSQVERASSELPAVRDGFVDPRSTGSSLPARLTEASLPTAPYSTDEVKQLLPSQQEHVELHPPSEGRDTSCLKRRYLLKALHAPPRSNLPIATLDVLKSADGILLGISTRFGTLPAQVKELFDACGDL
ncbi:hypothetical protein PF005_g11939 [Phytophthora fragariae]|uniref:Uncharacterized protein n=1 Tax=Phytophthora fragariae TaxID=53985 RepID=A0A6A3RCH6_9STRA|nr:hypothetical protein PF007_g17924 [Phytophthora fragariae]KAE9209142.1 hypothetical protein PF005_g11939 [Phytophthora fragariae]KAE9301578.1 hypothetical protein PF001_g14386 [Phytophthora fragariae]